MARRFVNLSCENELNFCIFSTQNYELKQWAYVYSDKRNEFTVKMSRGQK